MPLPKVHKNVQDQQGNIVPQVLGSVFNQGTGVLAPLFGDDAGTVPLSNPMTSDATYGSFKFYVNPGHYDLTFTKPGYTFESIMDFQVPEDVLTLGTMAQQDASAVAITGGGAALTANSSLPLAQFLTTGTYLPGPVGMGTGPVAGSSLVVGGGMGIDVAVSPGVKLNIQFNKSTESGLRIQQTTNDAGPGLVQIFYDASGTPIGSISGSGSGVAYNTTSDQRLKHAIATLAGALDVIQALRPVAFRWNADDSPGHGFLAHELQRVVPDAVTGEPDAAHADGSVRPQQVDHSRLVPWLTAAIAELAALTQALTQRVASLEEQLGL